MEENYQEKSLVFIIFWDLFLSVKLCLAFSSIIRLAQIFLFLCSMFNYILNLQCLYTIIGKITFNFWICLTFNDLNYNVLLLSLSVKLMVPMKQNCNNVTHKPNYLQHGQFWFENNNTKYAGNYYGGTWFVCH